ncbi:MAG: HRDC domain-containing protein [Leptospirales bacterium]|nr:HRDC domain-containing protein [Leptospirales bacterium]
MADYLYIERQHQLELAATQLGQGQWIAVDTESSGYFTYQPELCLVQISSPGGHYLIDPLAALNLAPLAPIFASPAITKIFHAAASDMVELRRAHPFEFCCLFDTMIACRMLGLESCSLSSLVQRYLGLALEKKEQKSNWKRRPLTRSQLDYAHTDTIYLHELMQRLAPEIESSGVREEMNQELERLCSAALLPEERREESDAWLRLPGALDLAPRQRAILRELAAVREHRARQENLAVFRIATNDVLLQLLQLQPAAQQELERVRGLHPALLRKDGRRLLQAFQGDAIIKDEELPRREELSSSAIAALKRLKRWRTRIAELRGMDPSMVVNNRALQAIAEAQPASLAELQAMDLLSRWKLQHYGDHLLRVAANTHDGRLPADLPRNQKLEGASLGVRG